jgi:hypothetical protein
MSEDEEVFAKPTFTTKKRASSEAETHDGHQRELESLWGAAASSAWKCTYEEIQSTWSEILEHCIEKRRWGDLDLEECWEVTLATGDTGRPTKEVCRKKTRRTKEELAAGVPMKSEARVRPYCTHIALRAVQKFPLPRLGVTDASHLCHNPLCVRPEHLIVEPRVMNHKRKNCLHKIQTPCCGQTVLVCKHDPPCIHDGLWSNE